MREQAFQGGRTGPSGGDAPGTGPLEPELPAVHRYLIRVLVDRASADSFYECALPELLRAADPGTGRCRSSLRDALLRLLDDRLRAPGDRDDPPPLPAIDREAEAARFDSIWRTHLLERTWQRLDALQASSGQPLHLALYLRAEAPGLSLPELADRIAAALGRPVSADDTRQLLRRAGSEFSRMLLEEVIATLPEGSPFEAIERELIETNLLAFCLESLAPLRNARKAGPHSRPPRRSSR